MIIWWLMGCAPDVMVAAHDTGRLPPETSVEGTAVLEASGVITCGDPVSTPEYTQIELGSAWVSTPAVLGEGGGGVVVADLNGDSWLDIVLPRAHHPTAMWLGGPDGRLVSPETPRFDAFLDSTGGSAADVDGDGDLDLLIYRYQSPALLLLNDGAAHFETIEIEDPDEAPVGCGGSASWADMDLDGDLDLFLGRQIFRFWGDDTEIDLTLCPSRLLENVGGAEFVDRSSQLSEIIQVDKVFASGWVEVDGDPWPELYVVADVPALSPGNVLMQNDASGLVPTASQGLDIRIEGMGLGQGDLNGDGVWDYVVPGSREIAVLMAMPDLGIWADASVAVGLVPDRERDQVQAWGGEVADLDNDTHLDVVMTYGPLINQSGLLNVVSDQPDEVYRQVDGGRFEAVGEAWGFSSTANSRGTVTADLNRDGTLDIVRRTFGEGATVYQSRCSDAGWLLVRVQGSGLNPSAIGAEVQIEVDGRVLTRRLESGSTSFQSGAPPEVHFGLGSADRVDRLRVTWPDGTVAAFDQVETRQVLDVRRGPSSN